MKNNEPPWRHFSHLEVQVGLTKCLEADLRVRSQAWTDAVTGHKASLKGEPLRPSVLQEIEWKSECRGDEC